MKWSFPHFGYAGQMMCGVAAFKAHVALGFWKASLLDDPKHILRSDGAMGNLGKITKLSDLPSDKVLTGFIRQAMKLNDEGKVVPRSKPKKIELEMPRDFENALKKNVAARSVFDAFSPSSKREYIEWITEAKTEATREKRLATALEWIAEGKIRNWKYVRK